MLTKRISTLVLATTAAGFFGAGAVQSRASILITIQESGSDVVATATGSADLGGLTASSTFNDRAEIFPASGLFAIGSTSGFVLNHYVIPI